MWMGLLCFLSSGRPIEEKFHQLLQGKFSCGVISYLTKNCVKPEVQCKVFYLSEFYRKEIKEKNSIRLREGY